MILLHSPGRKPWVNYWNTFIEPQRGGTFQRMQSHEPNARCECRSYGAQSAFVCVYPGFCSCLWHSRHPGLCRSVVPTALRMHLKFDALALVERSYLTNFCLVYIGVIKSIGCSRIILLQPIFLRKVWDSNPCHLLQC